MSEEKTIYSELEEIHWWHDYYSRDPQHLRYDTNLIFAGHKIGDLYYACSSARSCLHYMDNTDYGDFARDDFSKLWVTTLLIQNSLIYYNIAVDYSWQYLWLFYDYNLIGKLPTNKLYQDSIKDCEYETLLYRLTLIQDIKLRDEIVKKYFERSKLYNSIRPKYNYLKHRGTYHFNGLGSNERSLLSSIQGKNIELVCRKELDIQGTKQELMSFDKEFIPYCNHIIKLLMPDDFKNNSFNIGEISNFYHKYQEEIDSLENPNT